MSVTYIYSIDSAGDLTSASTNSTSGNTMNTDELLWVTSGSTVSGAVLQTSSVSLTGSGTAVTNPGNGHWTYNGGSITAQGVTQPLTGGAALVDNGATLTQGTAYQGGGIMVLSGGVTSGSILSGGFETIVSGGAAFATITNGGNENIYNGATATSTGIAGGGQEIYSGGTALSATINAGGTQYVWSGGTANNDTINGGGTQIISAGGGSFASDNIAGQAQVYGLDVSGTVIDTGVMDVMSGGNAKSTFLTSGGTQIISAGGVGNGVNLEILGTQTVQSGGAAYNTYLTGGILNVQSGGIALDPLLTSASYTVSSGSTTSTVTISGGEIVISGGGTVIGASGTAGTIEVLSGGSAHASVLSGGQQILMGGTASGTQIMSGGSEVVVSGSSINPIVYAGGSETVYGGATIQNVEISGAGTLSLETGANVIGDVLFGPAGGHLQLIGAALPAIKIDGLAIGDSIDLNNISGGTGGSYSGGTLTVTGSSGTLATLSLGTAPDGMLTVASDGHGGTLITFSAFTAAQAVSTYQSNGLPGGAQIADSAANVSANIDALGTIANAGKLVGITLTDSGTPAIAVTAAQFAADGKAIAGISGNFVLDVTASASATITGLAAHATVVEFSGASTAYTVAAGNGTITVTGTGLTDTINSVTALQFSNTTEIVATASHAAGTTLSSLNVAELYSAALNRAPDVAGLNYYETVISANPTLSGVTLGEFFLSSSEYTKAHSYAQSSAGDTQFINDLYTNVLHRSGSSSEVSFYQTVINGFLTGQTAGTAAYTAAELQAHAQVLQYFSASAEFLSDIQITAQNPASASHWLLLI